MARKRFISQDDLDDLLDLNDSYSEEFSDLSDSEDDVHALYVSSDSDESSSDEEEATVRPHVPVSSLSADPTTVASASATSSSTSSNPATSTGSSCDGWVEIARDPPNFPFNENVGLKTNLSNLADFVDLFFSKELLEMLVKQTNLYASQTIAKMGPLRRSSRMKHWKEIDVAEMKVFLGLMLQMGPCSLPSLDAYWSTSVLYDFSLWSSLMSRNRFQILLRFFHFVDTSIQSEDRLYKVRPIMDYFNNIMKKNYVPDKSLCIDESMMLWRGRLIFRQYIKNKKRKYGVKLYELCESNGLIIKIKICCGKEEGAQSEMGHASDVVLHLAEDFLDKGYVLFMDNFYNSVSLTKALTSKSTYVCGTLRSNRKGNPKDVIAEKLKKGEMVWRRNMDVTVCKWKDKRDVLTISNMHRVEMVEVRNRNGKVMMKPNIVRDYNAGMSGVDRSDQMLSYYSALRKTIRWPKKVGLHIFEMMIHNAHSLYCQQSGSKMKRLSFREQLVLHLLHDKLPNAKRRRRDGGCVTQHYLEYLPPTEKKQRPTKPCRVCTRNKKRKETRYFCAACEDHPPLCVVECFKTYHSNA